jgi:rubrerythrin
MGIGEKTEHDLNEAFAGESQANRKYLAFAKKADKEGYAQAAKLFRAAAESETIHAHRHLAFIGGVGDTQENLAAALAGETYEFEKMYPQFMADAAASGDDDVAQFIKFVAQVEHEHADLYREMADSLGNTDEVAYYICNYCGHVHLSEAPDHCPVCGAPKTAFKEVV